MGTMYLRRVIDTFQQLGAGYRTLTGCSPIQMTPAQFDRQGRPREICGRYDTCARVGAGALFAARASRPPARYNLNGATVKQLKGACWGEAQRGRTSALRGDNRVATEELNGAARKIQGTYMIRTSGKSLKKLKTWIGKVEEWERSKRKGKRMRTRGDLRTVAFVTFRRTNLLRLGGLLTFTGASGTLYVGNTRMIMFLKGTEYKEIKKTHRSKKIDALLRNNPGINVKTRTWSRSAFDASVLFFVYSRLTEKKSERRSPWLSARKKSLRYECAVVKRKIAVNNGFEVQPSSIYFLESAMLKESYAQSFACNANNTKKELAADVTEVTKSDSNGHRLLEAVEYGFMAYRARASGAIVRGGLLVWTADAVAGKMRMDALIHDAPGDLTKEAIEIPAMTNKREERTLGSASLGFEVVCVCWSGRFELGPLKNSPLSPRTLMYVDQINKNGERQELDGIKRQTWKLTLRHLVCTNFIGRPGAVLLDFGKKMTSHTTSICFLTFGTESFYLSVVIPTVYRDEPGSNPGEGRLFVLSGSGIRQHNRTRGYVRQVQYSSYLVPKFSPGVVRKYLRPGRTENRRTKKNPKKSPAGMDVFVMKTTARISIERLEESENEGGKKCAYLRGQGSAGELQLHKGTWQDSRVMGCGGLLTGSTCQTRVPILNTPERQRLRLTNSRSDRAGYTCCPRFLRRVHIFIAGGEGPKFLPRVRLARDEELKILEGNRTYVGK
ncbi:hypothetical protein B0H11DRAFT_2201843 [Mycena galericulata]|nr:hypothetical protein B0H11DRAFT_2201843 [Mycena galericulata]